MSESRINSFTHCHYACSLYIISYSLYHQLCLLMYLLTITTLISRNESSHDGTDALDLRIVIHHGD